MNCIIYNMDDYMRKGFEREKQIWEKIFDFDFFLQGKMKILSIDNSFIDR